MTKPRVIARLDIKAENVVKGVRYEGLRVVGKPDELARSYYNAGADELLYIDTVASLYGRNNLTDVVERAAKQLFVPMTVGGGIRSVEDALLLLRSGADKVALNTAAIARPELISELAQALGAQAVVVSIQAKTLGGGRWEAYVDNGRERTGLNVVDWARKAVCLGAGELLVTSVDRDGTGLGYDVELLSTISKSVSVPVVGGGGAKGAEDVANLLSAVKLGGVALASALHYGRTEILQVKAALEARGIPVARHGR